MTKKYALKANLKIGGKIYHFFDDYYTKGEAKREAAKLRRTYNRLARVVPAKSGLWYVYTRNRG